MITYRLYEIEKNGHVTGPPRVLRCKDDDTALIEARQYVDGHTIEVWADDKRVGLIASKVDESRAASLVRLKQGRLDTKMASTTPVRTSVAMLAICTNPMSRAAAYR